MVGKVRRAQQTWEKSLRGKQKRNEGDKEEAEKRKNHRF